MLNSILTWIQKILASLFFIGYFPWASGTIGSAIATFSLWFFLSRNNIQPAAIQWWLLAIFFVSFSVIVSSRPKEVFKNHDPKPVIIDEVTGQIISFLFIPLSIKTLILGFFLFRLFDIVKPYPVYKMEYLEGGLGITMDDVMAGILTNVSLLAILWFYHFIKAML